MQGFYARTWDSARPDTDDARYFRVSYNGAKYAGVASVLDVEDNFEPEVGYVNRRRGLRGFRRYEANMSYLPRPKAASIRNLRFTPNVQVISDKKGAIPYWRARVDGVIAFQSSDRILARVERIRDVVTPGLSPFGQATRGSPFCRANMRSRHSGWGRDTANYRKWNLDLDFQVGTYYTGRLYRITSKNVYRPNGRLGLELIYDGSWIHLPQANLDIQALSARIIYSFTTDFFVKIFAQWNNDSESVGANVLLNYRFRPGSDIFFVYDHGFGTADNFQQTNRAVLLKVSYLIGL